MTPEAVSDVQRVCVIVVESEMGTDDRGSSASERVREQPLMRTMRSGRGKRTEGDSRIYIEIKFGRGAKSLSANLYLTVNHWAHTAMATTASQRVKFRRQHIIIIIIIIMVVFNIKRRVHIFASYVCV